MDEDDRFQISKDMTTKRTLCIQMLDKTNKKSIIHNHNTRYLLCSPNVSYVYGGDRRLQKVKKITETHTLSNRLKSAFSQSLKKKIKTTEAEEITIYTISLITENTQNTLTAQCHST